MTRPCTLTSATWPPPASPTLTPIRSAEGNDEEGLSVLYGRAAGHEHLADLAVGRRPDLGDMTEGLDPPEHVATRHRVAGAPLARDAEDADRRRVDALCLFGRSFLVPCGGRGRVRALRLPRHRDREPVRFDLDGDGGEPIR